MDTRFPSTVGAARRGGSWSGVEWRIVEWSGGWLVGWGLRLAEMEWEGGGVGGLGGGPLLRF